MECNDWLLAEDVDWERCCRRALRSEQREDEGRKEVKLDVVKKEEVPLVLDLNVEKVTEAIERSRDEEMFDSCSLLVKASSSTSKAAVAARFFIKPLVCNGGKDHCELAERVMKETTDTDELVQSFVDDNVPLFPTEEALLFWQRCIFDKPIKASCLNRIIMDLDGLPATSSRLPSAILALTKSNGDQLASHVSSLLTLLNRCSGVMVGPAKKALQLLQK
jgi:hypothetical protein